MNVPPSRPATPPSGLPPAGPPPPPGRDQVEAFTELTRQSLPAVRASAQVWRNGLSGLITLVGTGAVISGRTTASDLSTGWRLMVTTAIEGSLALAIRGLWVALTVETGGRRTQVVTLDDILNQGHATVAAFQAAQANAAGRELQAARNAGAGALVLLLTGILLTWWAPSAPKRPAGYVLVAHAPQAGRASGAGKTDVVSETNICGVLQSADGGRLRLKVKGRHDPVIVPLTDVANLTVVDACQTG